MMQKKYTLRQFCLQSSLTVCLLFLQVSISHAYEDPLKQVTQLAYQGDLNAQVELAGAYEHGQGIHKDYKKALKWYCRAALNGSVEAQSNLAWMLLNERGIKNNEALAIHWFKIAAKSGDKYAHKILSRLDKNLKVEKFICRNFPIAYWETKKCQKKCQKIVSIVKKSAPLYGLEARLILAVIQYESNFKEKALSAKNAMGLMQLLPETATRFGVKNIWDPQQNIEGGMRYLKWLIQHFNGNVTFALAGYNAGENAVQRYQGIPPYQETRQYVKHVIRL